jgi:hypothetical protein
VLATPPSLVSLAATLATPPSLVSLAIPLTLVSLATPPTRLQATLTASNRSVAARTTSLGVSGAVITELRVRSAAPSARSLPLATPGVLSVLSRNGTSLLGWRSCRCSRKAP